MIGEYLSNLKNHFFTICTHKKLVRQMCFKCGMYSQGIKHDWSKFSWQEFWPSVKNYQGDKSPITFEKEIYGFSSCWLHHKGRNKHHWEYWIDRIDNKLEPIEMPFNYVLESAIDKIAASKVYKKENFTKEYPYEFFINSKEYKLMNSENASQIRRLLDYYKENDEDNTMNYYKKLYEFWRKNKYFKM